MECIECVEYPCAIFMSPNGPNVVRQLFFIILFIDLLLIRKLGAASVNIRSQATKIQLHHFHQKGHALRLGVVDILVLCVLLSCVSI